MVNASSNMAPVSSPYFRYSHWVVTLLLLSLSQLPPLTTADSSSIKAKSVSYCSDPATILVEKFGVRYFKDNSTLNFDLSATSFSQGLNLGAQFNLNAYGIHALNVSIDLCSFLSGLLCPLPTYNFTGSGQYTIPASRIPSIPNIAWIVPDIEAVFNVELIDNSTNLSAACLQATLTNGLTVGLSSVVWASASVLIVAALLTLLAAVLAPTSAFLTTPGTFFYLLGIQIQQMAMCGMLSLNYPLVLRIWTTNFAYSVGLISSSAISRSIDGLRNRNGGNGFRTMQDTVALISRLYSPYNQDPATIETPTNTSSSARFFIAEAMSRLVSAASPFSSTQTFGDRAATLSSNVDAAVPTVTLNTTLIDPGLAAYTNQIGFPAENAFMFLFIWLLILVAFFICCLLFVSPIILLIPSKRKDSTRLHQLNRLLPVASAIGLRVLLFAYPPLSLFTFWQWRLGRSDSWVPIFFSVFLWFGVTFALAFIAWKLVRHHHNHQTWKWAVILVGMFKPGKWWLIGPLSLIHLLRIAFIGFGQGSGQTQVISEMILFLAQFSLLVVYRPFGASLLNVAAIIQSMMGLIQSIILQFLVPSVAFKPIPRAVLGFVVIAVHAIGFISVLIFGAWPLIGEFRTFFKNKGLRIETIGAGDRVKPIKDQDELNQNDPSNRFKFTNARDDDIRSYNSSSHTRLGQPENPAMKTTDDHLL